MSQDLLPCEQKWLGMVRAAWMRLFGGQILATVTSNGELLYSLCNPGWLGRHDGDFGKCLSRLSSRERRHAIRWMTSNSGSALLIKFLMSMLSQHLTERRCGGQN